MPRVSVFMPTFCRNMSGHLAKAIQSVQAQTFTDFEFLIVDDGSTDGSADTIRSFAAADHRIKHIRLEENVGLPALTTVRALKESTGEFIAWIFDDCEWDAAYLQEMVNALDSSPDQGLAYAQCKAFQSSDGLAIYGRPIDYELLQSGINYIANCATFFRRSLVDEIGWYDPRIVLIRNCDWDFLSRASFVTNFVYVPKILTYEHGSTLSNSLGNTYSADANLVIECSRSERPELLVDTIQEVDVLSLPQGAAPTEENLKAHLHLVIEFAFIRWREPMFAQIASLPHFKRLVTVDSNSTIKPMIQWWIKSTKEMSAEAMSNKDRTIDDLLRKKSITSRTFRQIKRGLKAIKSTGFS
jgi:GT2 family glycosyltransferase